MIWLVVANGFLCIHEIYLYCMGAEFHKKMPAKYQNIFLKKKRNKCQTVAKLHTFVVF